MFLYSFLIPSTHPCIYMSANLDKYQRNSLLRIFFIFRTIFSVFMKILNVNYPIPEYFRVIISHYQRLLLLISCQYVFIMFFVMSLLSFFQISHLHFNLKVLQNLYGLNILHKISILHHLYSLNYFN